MCVCEGMYMHVIVDAIIMTTVHTHLYSLVMIVALSTPITTSHLMIAGLVC